MVSSKVLLFIYNMSFSVVPFCCLALLFLCKSDWLRSEMLVAITQSLESDRTMT